jgi:hypothetical protein
MVMGVQRSGTTALSETLATDPSVRLFPESEGNEIYSDWLLRPESEIRPYLLGTDGTVVLKPVRESDIRSPLEVALEYRRYDLTIVWLYRDPFDVLRSWQAKGWAKAAGGTGWLLQTWMRRNRSCLTSRTALGKRLIVVRYEDLVAHPECVDELGRRLGLAIHSTLRRESVRPREAPESAPRLMPMIERTLSALDAARDIRPRS